MAHSGGSANEAEDEAPTNEGVAGRLGAQTVGVTGGDWSHAILGNPTIHKTIIHNNQDPPSTLKLPEGTYQLSPKILVFEKNPLNAESRVYRAKLLSQVTGDRDIIVKILPDGERQRREAKIHFSVPEHPNIVPRLFIDSFDYRGFASLYIAMENCDSLNLYQYIKDQNRRNVPFDPSKYLSFARQITKGLDFLHKCNVIHRDLKPPNILLSQNKTVVKICDFGLSKTVTGGQTSATLSMMQPGTDGWKSPEVLMNAERISTSADIFSLALVVYHTLSYGGHPFGNDPHSWNHYIKRNENLDLTGLMVPNMGHATQLLASMLDPDPTKRPKAEEVLDHPFFKGTPPIQATRDQVNQLAHQTYMSLIRGKMPGIAQPRVEALLPGVRETSAQLSENMSRLINEGPFELKPKVQGMPPIRGNREQVTQLANQTYMSLARERMPRMKQAQQGGALMPGVQETSVLLSEDMSRLISEGPLELKPKVQDQGSTKATTEQMSQIVIEALKKLQSGESIPSTRASRSSPAASGTAAELARTLSSYFEANHLKITQTPVTVHNAICCFDRKSQFLQAYDPAMKKWTKKQKLHKDMMTPYFTAAAVNGNIYVLMSNQQVYRLTQSDAGSIWKPVAPMMFGHGLLPPVVIIYEIIYVIGTYGGGSPSREAERYDPQLDAWSRITDMETVKRNHTLAATKGHIYCIGGWDGKKYFASVERFNPGDQSWSDVAPMKAARAGAASAVLESKIFVLGGWRGGILGDVECYDPDTNTWTPVVNMRIERIWFSAVVVNGKIFAVGGDGREWGESKTIEMYDSEKKRWEVVEQVGDMGIYSLAAIAIKM